MSDDTKGDEALENMRRGLGLSPDSGDPVEPAQPKAGACGRVSVDKAEHERLKAGGADYPGRETIRRFMRRLGRG